jgi:hypothetical protein
LLLGAVERAAAADAQVHVAPPLEQVQANRLEQQMIVHRRGPLQVLLTQPGEPPIIAGLR